MKEIYFCQTFFNSFVSHIYNLYKDTFLETYFKTGFYPFWKHILKWWTKQPPSVLGDENRIFMKTLNYIYIYIYILIIHAHTLEWSKKSVSSPCLSSGWGKPMRGILSILCGVFGLHLCSPGWGFEPTWFQSGFFYIIKCQSCICKRTVICCIIYMIIIIHRL